MTPIDTPSGGEAVLEKTHTTLKPPPMYKVILLNDDFTTMEFVVFILQQYFHKDEQTAFQIMMQVHKEGRGVCGIYSKDIASTKISQVAACARQEGHPLQCVMVQA